MIETLIKLYKKETGLTPAMSEEDYRAMLKGMFNVGSSKELSF